MSSPAYSESLPSVPKRRRTSKLEILTVKKQRIPEISTKEIADSIGDRRVIGDSVLLRDGGGKSPSQRPTPEPIQSSFEAEDSDRSSNKPGYNSFNPIIIDDEFPSEAQKTSIVRAPTNRSEETLSRSDRTMETTTDEGVLRADIIEINPDDSDESDHEELLVSLLDQEFPEGLDEGRLVNLLVFKNLPTYITSRDITRLLNDSGFILAVDEIVHFRHGTISVKFTHAHIADAAFSVIHNKALPFPWRDHSAPLAVVRWVTKDGNPKDYALEREGPLSTHLVSVDSETFDSNSEGTSTEEGTDSESESDFDGGSEHSSTLEIISNNKPLGRVQTPTSRTSIHNLVSSFPEGPIPQQFSGDPSGSAQPRPIFRQVPSTHGLGVNPCRLPITPFNRPRRVLIPSHPDLPFVTVSMRADIQFISRETRQRISSYSLPGQHDDTRRVNDACSIGDTIVVAYELGPCQISLISMIKTPHMRDVGHNGHVKLYSNISPANSLWVSCLAPAKTTNSTTYFFTGGHDKSVKLWKVSADDRTSSETIARIGGATPLALGPRHDSILVGAGKVIATLDMNHKAAVPLEVKFSNTIHQIHIHPNAPNITILEVDHLDTQMQIYDNRCAGFNRPPDCAFGYRSEGKTPSRYNRGGTYMSYFVRGYEDGCVCIWDYRNSKCPVFESKRDHLVQPVFHSIITSSGIICYGVDGLAFRNHQGELL